MQPICSISTGAAFAGQNFQGMASLGNASPVCAKILWLNSIHPRQGIAKAPAIRLEE